MSDKSPRYIINPNEVAQTDKQRAGNWARELIKKHESKLDANKFQNMKVVTSGEVEPEAIDVRNVYPFPNLHWIIYRNDQNKHVMWSVSLMSNHRMLFTTTFAKV